MKSKASRYFFYILRFAKSKNKKKVINEIINEIKKRGVIRGIQNLLHRKAYGDISDFDLEFEPKTGLSIKNYDKTKEIRLPDSPNPEVSIIIPMYNQVDYTCNCIYAINECTELIDYEVIVADDNSPENTDILKRNFENLIIIRNEVNLGFLKNCNHAATKARGKYLVFLNNDTQVQKGWLEELLFVFRHHKNVGLVGSKLIYPDGKLQEAGGIIWQDGSGWNYGNMNNRMRPEYNYVKETDYISGASIMIFNELWGSIGGFDEMYSPAYCEDSDLCFEVRKRGYKVMYQPFSVVVHFEGITHGTDVNAGVKKYQVINQGKFIDKWHAELSRKSKNGEHVFWERDRTGGKKHVLVIDHYLPQIDKDAGSRTLSNFIDSMLELDYSVKFLGENQNYSKAYNKSFQEKGVEVLYGSEFNFDIQNWKKYLKVNLDNFDAILLSRSSVCKPILSYLIHNHYKGNIIYYGHDLGYRRLESEGIEKGDKSLIRLAGRIKADEDFMYEHANNSLVISMEEKNFLEKYIAKPLHYIPPYFFNATSANGNYEERNGILFVGGFNHPPNVDAIKWFLKEVYEALDKQGISLTIVGSNMPPFLFKYKDKFASLRILPNVSVTELEELYAKTRIAVVPLLSGAGVKGKVVEAMAKGVPVVGTDFAFEGMPKENDFIYKGVNSKSDMVSEIVAVYTNKQYWEKLSRFGTSYISGHFNKENMKKVFKDLIG